MRALLLLPLAALVTGCLAPGERDPTRSPWDPRNQAAAAPHPPIVARGATGPDPSWQPRAQPILPRDSYCIMAIKQESASGISIGAQADVLACSAPPNAPPPRPQPRR